MTTTLLKVGDIVEEVAPTFAVTPARGVVTWAQGIGTRGVSNWGPPLEMSEDDCYIRIRPQDPFYASRASGKWLAVPPETWSVEERISSVWYGHGYQIPTADPIPDHLTMEGQILLAILSPTERARMLMEPQPDIEYIAMWMAMTLGDSTTVQRVLNALMAWEPPDDKEESDWGHYDTKAWWALRACLTEVEEAELFSWDWPEFDVLAIWAAGSLDYHRRHRRILRGNQARLDQAS